MSKAIENKPRVVAGKSGEPVNLKSTVAKLKANAGAFDNVMHERIVIVGQYVASNVNGGLTVNAALTALAGALATASVRGASLANLARYNDVFTFLEKNGVELSLENVTRAYQLQNADFRGFTALARAEKVGKAKALSTLKAGVEKVEKAKAEKAKADKARKVEKAKGGDTPAADKASVTPEKVAGDQYTPAALAKSIQDTLNRQNWSDRQKADFGARLAKLAEALKVADRI